MRIMIVVLSLSLLGSRGYADDPYIMSEVWLAISGAQIIHGGDATYYSGEGVQTAIGMTGSLTLYEYPAASVVDYFPWHTFDGRWFDSSEYFGQYRMCYRATLLAQTADATAPRRDTPEGCTGFPPPPPPLDPPPILMGLPRFVLRPRRYGASRLGLWRRRYRNDVEWRPF